ncbi:MAG: hypothetical protein DMG24_01250 [Acidobacteria bacterium]|nr:MAG: hypothetical protein DMG24_01250 [Acidobacteriota bacterium]
MLGSFETAGPVLDGRALNAWMSAIKLIMGSKREFVRLALHDYRPTLGQPWQGKQTQRYIRITRVQPAA